MLWIGGGQLFDRRPDGRVDKYFTLVSKVHHRSCMHHPYVHLQTSMHIYQCLFSWHSWFNQTMNDLKMYVFLTTLAWRYNHTWSMESKAIDHTIHTTDMVSKHSLPPEWETGITSFGMCYMKKFCWVSRQTLYTSLVSRWSIHSIFETLRARNFNSPWLCFINCWNVSWR